MIKSYDLFKGAIINFGGIHAEVIEIFKDDTYTLKSIETGAIYGDCTLSGIEGIPITEDILSKWCKMTWQRPGIGGQDQWAGYGWWVLDKNISFIGTKNGKIWFQRNNDWSITHLHQLQQLVLVLKKEPLDITN